MHGLINRSIQCFIRDSYGAKNWRLIADGAGLGFESFEAMLSYDDSVTIAVLDAAAAELEKPRTELLEDLGTYLVSHPNLEALRRLMRFGGSTFVDFLHSLEDLQERAALAVTGLHLPTLELVGEGEDGLFKLFCASEHAGFGHVFVGILRAMSDDYGALALLDHVGREGQREVIEIHLIQNGYSAGREFDLAASSPQQRSA